MDEAVGLSKWQQSEDQVNIGTIGEIKLGKCTQAGLSDVSFDIVRDEGHSKISACSVTVAEENRQQPSCWGFTFKELMEGQAKDEDLCIILDWLLTEKVPEQETLFLSSPESKYYWLNKELFTLIDGVLFRRRLDSKDIEFVVPASLKNRSCCGIMIYPQQVIKVWTETKRNWRKSSFGRDCPEMSRHMCWLVPYAVLIRTRGPEGPEALIWSP